MTSLYRSEIGRREIESRYRDALAKWPVAHDELLIDTRWGATFVVASGPPDAPPIVLFQGSGANSALWIDDVASWSHDHRVFAVDVIGEPGLSASVRPALGTAAYAEWVDDVLAGLQITKASFIGVSLGGWIVLDYAIRRPSAVTSVVVQCPSGVGRVRAGFPLKAAALLLFGKRGRRRLMQLLVGDGRGIRPPKPEVARMLGAIQRHFRRRRSRIPVFRDDQLCRLAMPLLLIVGGRDPMIDSHETRRRLEQCVPNLQVELLSGAGHLVPPQTELIRQFLIEWARPAHGDRAVSTLEET
jgi:pimeloyl-ACP methyl ester carboxylesterase